jgi:hypothetical protein
LTSRSLARIRFEIVIRRTQKRPSLIVAIQHPCARKDRPALLVGRLLEKKGVSLRG